MLDTKELSLTKRNFSPSKTIFKPDLSLPLVFEPDADEMIRGHLMIGLNHCINEAKTDPSKYRIGFGPTYHLTSSVGVEAHIKVIFQKNIARDEITFYFLIAHDNKGQIIGYRGQSLYRSSDSQFESNGYIYTAVRKKGISTVIDSAHIDFLQRLAIQSKKRIVWKINNANAVELKSVEYNFRKDLSGDALKEFREQKLEQDRWKKQYGKGGKFKITDDRRVFRPLISRLTTDYMPEDVESIKNIFMARKGNKFEAVEIERVLRYEKPELHVRNQTEFQKLISPYLNKSQRESLFQ